MVATGVPIFKSLVRLDPEKIPAQAGFEPGSSALEAEALPLGQRGGIIIVIIIIIVVIIIIVIMIIITIITIIVVVIIIIIIIII